MKIGIRVPLPSHLQTLFLLSILSSLKEGGKNYWSNLALGIFPSFIPTYKRGEIAHSLPVVNVVSKLEI